MTPLQKLGKQIKIKRNLLGISQEKLAEYAGVHRTYMGAVERGEINIAFENLRKIATALKTTIGELTNDI
jgi:transcriptional regulator with XRE-family HTH domain